MTKKEIIEKNKETIESILKYYEGIESELLDLFNTFATMAADFIYELYKIVSEEEFVYKKMDIRDSIKLVREFLKDIDSNYLNIFDKSLSDGTFELFLPEDDLVKRPDEPITFPKPGATIYIPVQNNATDGSIIVHEFFHYLNDDNELIINRDIFTEMISIYFELRYCQYLDLKKINCNAFNKEVCERLDNSLIASDNLCFTSSALDIYHNTAFSEGISDFESDVSYVIGTLLAFYALKEPRVNDIKMKYINDNINSMQIEDVFNILDTSIEEYPKWIEACKEILKKAKSESYEESYSYSRTNRSR